MKEEVLGRQIGEVLKGFYVPGSVLNDIIFSLRSMKEDAVAEMKRMQSLYKMQN